MFTKKSAAGQSPPWRGAGVGCSIELQNVQVCDATDDPMKTSARLIKKENFQTHNNYN